MEDQFVYRSQEQHEKEYRSAERINKEMKEIEMSE